MIRKELYKEIVRAVVSEANITGSECDNEIEENLLIDKLSEASHLLLPQLTCGGKDYLKCLVQKLADCCIDPNIDLEEDINDTYHSASFEGVDASRKIHLHGFYYDTVNCVVITSECLFHDACRNFSDVTLWKAVEKLWVKIWNLPCKANFFQSLQTLDDSHYFILKDTALSGYDNWRVFSELYFEKVVNGEVPVPQELAYTDTPLHLGLTPDWNNFYEQYHEAFNIIADMRNANDLLTRFLKMYQVLEFFTFRMKLIPLAIGQATRNSFISNVRREVEQIAKSELKSLQELFEKAFSDIQNVEVKDLTEPALSSSKKLRAYLSQNLSSSMLSMLGLRFSSIANEKHVAELIYKIRCCIVHSKESEMHFTPNNISEYKELIPIMRVLIKVMQKSFIETINDSSKVLLEFHNDSMRLY